MESKSLPPAEIVEHAAFVRRLALHLLLDDQAAEDAAQQTILCALEHPPRSGPRVRAWLAAVLRNVVRKGHRNSIRRARREQVAARPEAVASSLSAAARAEIIAIVARAIRRLDPVSLEVVLLRHYEDLPPREIAERLGVSVDTVSGRLKRAHAKLRAYLDEERGGNVEAWRALLGGLVGLPALSSSVKTGVPVGGGIAVGTAMKAGIGVAAAAALGAGAWWVAVRPSGSPGDGTLPAPTAVAGHRLAAEEEPGLAAKPAPPSDAAVAPATIPPADDLPAGWTRKHVGRLSVAIPGEWKEEDGPDAASRTWSVADPSGRPSAAFGVVSVELAATFAAQLPSPTRRSVTVLGRPATWSEGEAKGRVAALVLFDTSDADTPGFAIVCMAPKESWASHAAVVERILGLVRLAAGAASETPSAPVTVVEPSPAQLVDLAGSIPAGTIEVRVLHGLAPVTGARVQLLASAVGPVGAPPPPAQVLGETVTGADGIAALGAFDPGTYTVSVDTAELGTRTLVIEQRAGGSPRPRSLVVYGEASVSGRLWDREGRPAGGRAVRAVPQGRGVSAMALARGETDSDGRYVLRHLTSGTWLVIAPLSRAGETPYDDRQAPVKLGVRESATLDLGTETPEPIVRGQVRQANGTPLRGRGVSVSLVHSAGVVALPVLLDENGRYERRVPPGRYSFEVFCRGFGKARVQEDVTLPAGGLTRDIIVPGVCVTCRVVDAATRNTLPPAEMSVAARVTLRSAGATPRPEDFSLPVEADGTVRFFGVLPGRYDILASPPFRADAEGSSVTLDVLDRDVPDVELTIRAR